MQAGLRVAKSNQSGYAVICSRAVSDVPLSKFEPNETLNSRYAAMEKRLAVSFEAFSMIKFDAAVHTCLPGKAWRLEVLDSPLYIVCHAQVVRKRLNRPLTLAEKVSQGNC